MLLTPGRNAIGSPQQVLGGIVLKFKILRALELFILLCLLACAWGFSA